jgi:hypothetical protein
MYSGNFASVFKIACPGEQVWAVKCFTRQVADLQERYREISDHLDRHKRKFAVEFVYLPEGIRINGSWYPILKMRWVEGFTLNEFLRDQAGQPALLEQLCQLWLRLASELREARMAHGDLQHGNVVLVPGSKSTSIALRLIDYDGMWVPSLADRPPGEVGHPNYQHPSRLRSGGYSADIDRFSHLVIYSALRFLAVGGKALWDRHDNAENLLFRAADFRTPNTSKLVADLLALPGDDVRALLGHLIDASQQPIEAVPLLADLIDGPGVAPLSREQAGRLLELFPGTMWPAPTVPSSPPRVAPPLGPTRLLTSVFVMDALPVEGRNARMLVETPPSPAKQERASPPMQARRDRVPRIAVPPPPRRRLPWPELPAWARLGFSPRSLVVQYWPVTLGILLSLPGLALVVWLLWEHLR